MEIERGGGGGGKVTKVMFIADTRQEYVLSKQLISQGNNS